MKTFVSKNEYDNLSTTAQDFFHFIESFGKQHQLKNFVYIWMLEDLMQKLTTSTCGPFQLYFFENVFNSDENSCKQQDNKITKKTMETLIN